MLLRVVLHGNREISRLTYKSMSLVYIYMHIEDAYYTFLLYSKRYETLTNIKKVKGCAFRYWPLSYYSLPRRRER